MNGTFTKVWELKKKHEVRTKIELGGNNCDTINEPLTVDQNTQKILKYVISKLSNNKKINYNELNQSTFPKNSFLLNTILQATSKNKATYNRTIALWCPTISRCHLSPVTIASKEKLEINRECQDILKEMRAKRNIYLLRHRYYLSRNFQRYNIEYLSRTKTKKYLLNKTTLLEPWISKLEENFGCFTTENLNNIPDCLLFIPDVITFDYIGNYNFKNYLIQQPINSINVYHKTKISIFRSWSCSHDIYFPEDHFYNLERSLLDDNFHELEFYMIRLKAQKGKNNKRGNYTCFSKRTKFIVWKLEKVLLKSIAWDPFKKINQNLRLIINELETITPTTYSIETDNVRFNYLKSNTLQLIDIQTKNFNSYQFGLNDVQENEPTKRKTDKKITDVTLSILHETSYNSSYNERTISTSLIPQKRSFLDPDLFSIIEKKKKMNKKRIGDNKSSQFITKKIKETLNFGINKESSINHPSSRNFESGHTFKLTTPNPPIQVPNKTIIINTVKLLSNHTILHELVEYRKLNVIERNINLPCDFILSTNCCVVRIKLEVFQQYHKDGTLFYSSIFTELVRYFQKIIVFIDYNELSEQTDPDLFWKMESFLNMKQFKLHIIPESETDTSNKLIISYLLKYIKLLSQCLNKTVFNNAKNSDVEFLTEVTHNPLLSTKILENYTLLQFLKLVQRSKTSKDDAMLQQLTYCQWKSIKNLLCVTW